jgi:mycofactocin glycosyltransferase
MATPDELGVGADEPLPVGTVVEMADDVAYERGGILVGGSPTRVLRLSGPGRDALAEITGGPIASPGAAQLGRKLTDTGLAAARAQPVVDAPTVTVVVPVRDRETQLDRCLDAVGDAFPVVVVDDGSVAPGRVAAVAGRHRATVLRHPAPRGPAAARNAALGVLGSAVVAFVDSDCVPPAGWIPALLGHFADPLVAAVAPRIVGVTEGGGGIETAVGWASPLDMGPRSGPVAPRTRLPYVPAAALLVRRCVLVDGFDEDLRYGEDVDLVWRLVESGWRVRYDASVAVGHAEPASLAQRSARRYHYGTSAAPLARRHPGTLARLSLAPGPAATVAALALGRPDLSALAFAATTVEVWRRTGRTGLPPRTAVLLSARGVWRTWVATGRWCQQLAWPLLAAAALRPGGVGWRRRVTRRSLVASLALTPALVDLGHLPRRWADARSMAAASVEQAAYGAGVVRGCLREGVLEPVLPAVTGSGTSARPSRV